MKMKAASFAVGLLSCLSLASPAHADEMRLKVDATPSIFSDMFKELVAGFEAKNPDIRIDLDTSQRDQTDMIQTTLRRGIVNDLPDMSFQGFNYLKVLADQNYLVPLDDIIRADPDWTAAQYPASINAASTIDGHITGLGVALSLPIIYYNAELIGEAQDGDKTLPSDWDKMLATARKIQSAHPGVLGAYTRYNSFLTQGHVMSHGAAIGTADGGAVTFLTPEALAAFDVFRRFGEAGQAEADMTDQQVRQSFTAGKLAILVDSSSSLESFQKQAAGKFTIGTATFPFAPKGGTLPTSGIAAVLHTKEPERQKAAWRFMRYVASLEGQVIVGKKTGYVPANEAVTSRPELLGDYYKERPAMNATLASIPHAAPWYVFKGQNNAQIDKLLLQKVQKIVTLKQSPEAAARELADAITPLIGK